MRSTMRWCAAGLLLLLTPSIASAWDSEGHMIVASLAYQQLSQPARDRIAVLLALNPSVAQWQTMIPASVPAADRPALLFAIAATWPDQIKSDPMFPDDGS
jgi:hypothetical protein